jgi:PAS domain S-box-containing protein
MLAAIVESSNDAIISKDLKGIVTTWNPAAERIFGYSAAETIGRPVTIIVPVELRAEEQRILESIRRGERVEHFETIGVRKDGMRVDLSLTVSPIRDAAGTIIGASTIARDITVHKRTQERLAVTLTSIGDAIISTDVDARVTFMNRAAEKLTGWSEEEALGQPLVRIFRIVNEATRQPVESPVSRVLQEGTVQGLANQTVLLNKDGAECAIDDSASPIRATGGELVGVVLVFRDITAARAAEIAMLRLTAIVEGSDDAIVGKDLRGVVTNWNPAAERIFGYTAREMIGQSITLLIPSDRLDEEQQILARLQRGEKVDHFETIRIRKDGHEIHVSLTISPIRDASGTIIGASKIARDITAQKNAERALRQAQAQLQHHARDLENQVRERTQRLHEMVAELDAFSYSLSHDLRSPLRAIQGFSEILLNEFGPRIPEGEEHLRRIARAAKRMDQLIQDVLTFSRVSRADIKHEPLDLEKLVATLVHDRPELQPPRARVTVEKPLLPVLGHEASLTQCLVNLLDNAVKFVAPGVTPEVRIATQEHDAKVRVTVTDNGIGIEPAAQRRVFGIFERLPTSRPYEGTGIGLAIVRKAAERMGGKVGVESKPGSGSTFWIELPRASETAR